MFAFRQGYGTTPDQHQGGVPLFVNYRDESAALDKYVGPWRLKYTHTRLHLYIEIAKKLTTAIAFGNYRY